MAIDEFNEFDAPRKWLDKKKYVRIDPGSGQPQLIRIEPIITEEGEFLPFSVSVYIDNGVAMVMDRDAVGIFLASMGCTPLEIASQFKHYWTH